MRSNSHPLDDLDIALLARLRAHPRVGVLELSRQLAVARATVAARLQRLEANGVIAGYGPEIDLDTAGFPVQAFVTLEIAQGALDQLAGELEALPEVIEAWATTGVGDVLCRVAAASHEDLQALLIALNRSASVARSTSVIVLSEVVGYRTLPLLARSAAQGSARAPAFRRDGR